MSLRETGLIRAPQPSPPLNELSQYTDSGFAPDIQRRTSPASHRNRRTPPRTLHRSHPSHSLAPVAPLAPLRTDLATLSPPSHQYNL